MHIVDGLGARLRLKAYAYITHGSRLLVFSHPYHPDAGIQVPGGTIGDGENPAAAVMREAEEETGLSGLQLRRLLGVCDHPVAEWGQAHRRHFFHLVCDGDPPERWRMAEEDPSDGGPEKALLALYWVDLPHGIPRLAPGHDAMLPELIRALGRC